MRIGYAIVYVSDMSRSVAFYRDRVGLPLRFESPEWTEFATEGSTLALHVAPSAGDPGSPKVAGRCQTGFSVPDIGAFHARMEAEGVTCVSPPTELHGTRLAAYQDPDGLIFSVGEHGGS